jgi:hypothetical protein
MTRSNVPELTDALIERMLVDRAGSRAPGDLVPGIVAALDGTPQARRGWPALRSPATPAARVVVLVTLGLLVALAVGAVLVGASLLRPRPLVLVPPSTIPSPAPTSPIPSPSATTLEAGPSLAFGDLPYGPDVPVVWRMFDATTGWYAVDDEATPLRLWRTTDAGASWIPVAGPRGPTAAHVDLIDPESVVLSYHDYICSRASGTVDCSRWAVTHDGGKTWQTTSQPEVAAMLGRLAVDPVLPIALPAALEWTYAAAPTELVAARSGWRDCYDTLFTTGTAVAGCELDDRLWLSLDRGRTWLERSFPVDDATRRDTFKRVVKARREPDGTITIVIDSSGGQGGSVLAIYTSQDDGRTWQPAGAMGEDRLPCNGYGLRLLSATDWVAFGVDPASNPGEPGFTVCSTIDAGAHWQTVRPRSPGGRSLRQVSFNEPSFITVSHLFVDALCGDFVWHPYPSCDKVRDRAHLLFETIDGGRGWHEVGGATPRPSP